MSDDLDAPSLVTLIAEVSMCGDCIARKSGVPLSRVDDMLKRVRESFRITTTIARCGACLKQTVVHRLG